MQLPLQRNAIRTLVRAGIEGEDGGRVERVAVHPHHFMVVDERGGCA
jgi:hypothetical protein